MGMQLTTNMRKKNHLFFEMICLCLTTFFRAACILANELLSRRSKEETPSVKKTIKKGLSATQKTLAFIGSALGIITASITIILCQEEIKKFLKSQRRQSL